ncbi:aspartyl-phosphate phosphatase Spo0E family protein [Clostridium sp. Mt-5]|uniref:Aspartyl-phosphate phosphatase Spo0E family protein n=1 Tax=Clostridium moutaii TaxID=3240932 RepID=A0ABV4BRJ4_9CLOT
MEKILEKLRNKLNGMLNSNEYTSKEILQVSQQLDELIVYYYKLQERDKT